MFIGIYGGITATSYVLPADTYEVAPSYSPPIASLIDEELTDNTYARQTLLDGYKDARRTELARKKSQETRKSTVSRASQPTASEAYYVVTAYTAGVESTGKRPGDEGYGVTASGEYVKEGVTVACPKSLPFGTRLHIEGVGYRICYDRGGDITQGRLDVYIADLRQAQTFGRQTLKVRILRKGAD